MAEAVLHCRIERRSEMERGEGERRREERGEGERRGRCVHVWKRGDKRVIQFEFSISFYLSKFATREGLSMYTRTRE